MTLEDECVIEFTFMCRLSAVLCYRLGKIPKKDVPCCEKVTKSCVEYTALCPCLPCGASSPLASSFPFLSRKKSFTFTKSVIINLL